MYRSIRKLWEPLSCEYTPTMDAFSIRRGNATVETQTAGLRMLAYHLDHHDLGLLYIKAELPTEYHGIQRAELIVSVLVITLITAVQIR